MGVHLALHNHVICVVMINLYTKKFVPTVFIINGL